jgi:hypothetical protein
MKRRGLFLIIAVNLLVLIALAFEYPHEMIGPGPLDAGHASLETDCFKCHAPWRGAANERCEDCHSLQDIGLRTTQGLPIEHERLKTSFHQALLNDDCTHCHFLHRPPALVRRRHHSFSHDVFSATDRARCESCHIAPRDRMHEHIDKQCGECHQLARWSPAAFDHDEYFRLDKRHNKKCTTCHTGKDYSDYTCYGCHEHKPQKIRAEHLEEGIEEFDDCAACHPDSRESHASRKPRAKPKRSLMEPTKPG